MRKLLLLVSLVVCAVTATTGSALAVEGAGTVKPSAAQKLGIGRNTITRKIQELGLDGLQV